MAYYHQAQVEAIWQIMPINNWSIDVALAHLRFLRGIQDSDTLRVVYPQILSQDLAS